MNKSSLLVKKKYYFKCDEENTPDALNETIRLIEDAFKDVKIRCIKKSRESSKNNNLFSPVDLNIQIKEIFKSKGLSSHRIKCVYPDTNIQISIEKANLFSKNFEDIEFTKTDFIEEYSNLLEELKDSDIKLYSKNKAWSRLTKGYISHEEEIKAELIVKQGKKYILNIEKSLDDDHSPFVNYISEDFVGFREMDFIHNVPSKDNLSSQNVGIEVQFGKYAFMVYNVCAKMKIFQKHGAIDYGIEIVPTKAMQKYMSTGVSFFEQFVWDLGERGSFSEDIPTIILGVEPNIEGYQMLERDDLEDVSIKANLIDIKY